MARVRKLSISMPPALAERIREAVREDGMSLSAFMAQAAEDGLRRRAMRIALEEWEAEYGPITPDDVAATDDMVVVVGPGEVEKA
jgi:hypothetical protein